MRLSLAVRIVFGVLVKPLGHHEARDVFLAGSHTDEGGGGGEKAVGTQVLVVEGKTV